jgi:hypothetical protein
MKAAFQFVNPSKLLNAFASRPPLFDPTSPVSDQALAFLHMALTGGPQFAECVASTGHSNPFIFSLATAVSLQIERDEQSHILPVLLSSILQLVAIPEVCTNLNASLPANTESRFRGSYADVLLGACTSVCPLSLWSQFGRIFHTLAPFLSNVTPDTVSAIMVFFTTIAASENPAQSVWFEAFARLVQAPSTSPNFRAQIFTSRHLFVPFEGSTEARVGPAAAIVLRFTNAAQTKAGARAIDVASIFPEIEQFLRKPLVLTTEMEKEWIAFLDELFVNAFHDEINEIRKLRRKRPD